MKKNQKTDSKKVIGLSIQNSLADLEDEYRKPPFLNRIREIESSLWKISPLPILLCGRKLMGG